MAQTKQDCAPSSMETVEAYNKSATEHLRARRFIEAEQAAQSAFALSQPENETEYGQSFDILCQTKIVQAADKKHIDEVIALCKEDTNRHGVKFWNQIHWGSAYYTSGDLENAEKHYSVARELPMRATHRTIGVYSTRSLNWLQTKLAEPPKSNLLNQSPMLIKNMQNPASDCLVFLLSCNSDYFQSWAEIFLASLSEVTENGCVHFHLIQASTTDFELLLQLQKTFGDKIVLNCTYEEAPFLDSDVNPETRRAYYATSRYLRTSAIRKMYTQDIIVSDIDLKFLSNPNSLKVKSENSDVGFRYSGPFGYFPWTRITANFCYVKANDATIEFFDGVAKFAASVFEEGWKKRPLWYVDQNALSFMEHLFSLVEPNVKFLNMNHSGTSKIVTFAQQNKKTFKQEAGTPVQPESARRQ